jgi:hypothetical protein
MWVEHTARIHGHNILVGKPERRNHLRGLSVHEGITLNRILNKYYITLWPTIAIMAASYEDGNQPSGSVKGG